MKHPVYLVIAAVLLSVVAAMVYYLFSKPSEQLVTTDVSLGRIAIKAEIADSFIERMRGLMFRESLPEDAGMLFIFDSDGRHGIWMMNTSIPLDIIWMDSEKRIVHIVENAQPCKFVCETYKPAEAARYVLEVNAGFVDRNSIKIGDIINFETSFVQDASSNK